MPLRARLDSACAIAQAVDRRYRPMNSELWQLIYLTVGCLAIYTPRLPARLVTAKVSGAGQRESRADELVWAVSVTGLHGPVLRFMRSDAQRERFLCPSVRARKSVTVENLRATQLVN